MAAAPSRSPAPTACYFCGELAPAPASVPMSERFVNAAHYDVEAGAYVPHRIHACPACVPMIASAPKVKRTRVARAVRFDGGGLAALAGFGSRPSMTVRGR